MGEYEVYRLKNFSIIDLCADQSRQNNTVTLWSFSLNAVCASSSNIIERLHALRALDNSCQVGHV